MHYVNNYLLRTTKIINERKKLRNTVIKQSLENGINIKFVAHDLLCLTFTIYSTADFLCEYVDAYKYNLLGNNT